MIIKRKSALLSAAVVVLILTFIQRSVKAAATGTSQGVTVIQLGCGSGGNGPAIGPLTSYLYSGLNACDGSSTSLPTPLPGGTLYNMRVLANAYTTNAAAKFKVSLFISGNRKPVMTCGMNVPQSTSCSDLADSVPLNAGDTVYATISIPDSNSQMGSATITLEENIIE
jgi:hypothetical protein